MRDFAFAAVLVAVIANSEILTLALLLIGCVWGVYALFKAQSEKG